LILVRIGLKTSTISIGPACIYRNIKYIEDLKRGPNAEIGPIDIFEIASSTDELDAID
jgi:hypothetical protein